MMPAGMSRRRDADRRTRGQFDLGPHERAFAAMCLGRERAGFVGRLCRYDEAKHFVIVHQFGNALDQIKVH